ncbi:MAG: hypothetical protein WBO00_12635 [Steroidobacteraceae bacterium]
MGAKEGIMKQATAFVLFCSICAAGISQAAESSAKPAQADETHQIVVAPDGVQHVSVVGGNYFFRPNHVIVRLNVPVEFDVALEKGTVPHSLVIEAPEAGIHVDEKLSSEVKKIRFTPTATGKYPFYCKNKLLFFKSHRDKGMQGVLEVVK